MRDKGFKIILIVNLLLFFIDFTTTMLNPTYIYLEVNPLYRATGSMLPIIGLNLLLFWLIQKLYYRVKSSPATRFAWINFLVTLASARLLAIHTAIKLLQNPITMEKAQQISTSTSVAQTQWVYIILTTIPYFIGIISYFFFKLDHKIERFI